MNEPNPKPIDPATPRAKSVKSYRLSQLYPQSMEDDVYIKPDNDSLGVKPNFDDLNRLLDEADNEDSENSN
jgi:hypothetical protein